MRIKFNFARAMALAIGVLKSQKRLDALFRDTSSKMNGVSLGDKERDGGLIGMLKSSVQMLKASVRGEYKGLSLGAKLTLVAGLIYFVTPLDMVPDFMPVAGYMDDLGVLFWVFRNLNKEVSAFREWERLNSGAIV
jgi:uncharacterized membrane protein YkvA (DUF1232 family)